MDELEERLSDAASVLSSNSPANSYLILTSMTGSAVGVTGFVALFFVAVLPPGEIRYVLKKHWYMREGV